MQIQIPNWATRAIIPDDIPADDLAKLNTQLGTSLVGNGSEPNPVAPLLDDFVYGGGYFNRTENPGDLATSVEVANNGLIELTTIGLIVAVRGDVFRYVAFFEFAQDSDLDADVPATFPGRTYTELTDPNDPDSGVERTHTWRTWEPNHQIAEYGGKFYKSSETSQAAMPASYWIGAGLTVKTVAEYRKIQAANAQA